MIRLDSVTRSYPEFQMELDLTVETGEIVSLLGPSGSGKTTALRLIAGFDTPESGRILVNGQDVTEEPPHRRRIGYVFQDSALFPHMTVARNVGYGLEVRGESRPEKARKTDSLLELVDLAGYGPREVRTLSGGERQRVAIAQALAVEPVMLLLDEPFSAIDELLRRDLRREIVRLQRELSITILFVTHSRREALSISNSLAILRDGRLEQAGSPRDLYYSPANEFVARFVGETVSIPTENGRALFRPEQIAILGTAEPTESSSEEDAARVVSREFQGASWLYELAWHEHDLLAYSTDVFQPGDLVRVLLPRESPLLDLSD